jgi:arsenite/tail-anchored protein-transporting ATPase
MLRKKKNLKVLSIVIVARSRSPNLMSIESLLSNDKLSFLFVGGKGGVGKTTSSSAIACQLAFTKKVLLISTDPAHSLSDAFRQKFTGEPTPIPSVPNLHVMEVNPEKYLKSELNDWAKLATDAGFGDSDFLSKISDFQQWLAGIPGIDEATALSSVISLIESGQYDIIVFDTAPTGHTLKLLQMPEVMQLGLEKLESWQTTLWNYWEFVKSTGKTNPAMVKKKVSQRIRDYKHGIEKVGAMLKDQLRTHFVVVCIAEYLSVQETQRLLIELAKNKVNATHIIVNQLIKDKISQQELSEIQPFLINRPDLLQKVNASAILTEARNSIQQKYLADLKKYPETQKLTVIEIPLLPKEITGPENLLMLSSYLLPPGFKRATDHPQLLTNRQQAISSRLDEESEMESAQSGDGFEEGQKVEIFGLSKSTHFNGKIAEIVKITEDGRIAVRVEIDQSYKILSLRQENLKPITNKDFL